MRQLIAILFVLLLYYPVYSQTTKYEYACGNQKSILNWTESKAGDLIRLKTVQGNEVHQYAMTGNYRTVAWEYSNTSENTNLKVVLENGVYQISGVFKSKSYSKSYPSKGYPWYQNIGFNIGVSIAGKADFKFECFRPDNLKLYEMQAESKEFINHEGIHEHWVIVHLTGMLSKFFSSDYYIDPLTKQFIRYRGVHGPPGTPETIITILK